MPGRLRIVSGLLAGVSAVGFAAPALAQDNPREVREGYFNRDANVSVEQRRAEQARANGIRLGLFILNPSLSVAAGVSDNYAASETNKKSATTYRVDADLGVSSDWSRHGLNIQLALPSTSYSSNDDGTDLSSTNQYAASISGTINPDLTSAINLGVSASRQGEPIGLADRTVNVRKPQSSETVGATIDVTKTFNRLRVSANAAQSKTTYDALELLAAAPIDGRGRDVTSTSYGVRADAALTARTAVFVEASQTDLKFDAKPPTVPTNQDSKGTTIAAGLNFDISRLARGELAVGSVKQEFENPARKSQTTTSVDAGIEFFPDPLVTVSVTGRRAFQPSNTQRASTMLSDDANIGVAYEFRRNVMVNVDGGYSRDEYIEINRQDRRYEGAVQVSYNFVKYAALTISASHFKQTSKGLDAGRTYDGNVGLIGIRFSR